MIRLIENINAQNKYLNDTKANLSKIIDDVDDKEPKDFINEVLLLIDYLKNTKRIIKKDSNDYSTLQAMVWDINMVMKYFVANENIDKYLHILTHVEQASVALNCLSHKITFS